MFLQIAGNYLPDYIALLPRIQYTCSHPHKNVKHNIKMNSKHVGIHMADHIDVSCADGNESLVSVKGREFHEWGTYQLLKKNYAPQAMVPVSFLTPGKSQFKSQFYSFEQFSLLGLFEQDSVCQIIIQKLLTVSMIYYFIMVQDGWVTQTNK